MTKFNVGDKVRATTGDWVGINTIGEVIEYDGSPRMPYKVDFGHGGFWLDEDEFEIVVNKPKKSARITALETQVATLQEKVEALESAGKGVGINLREVSDSYPLTARFDRMIDVEVDRILADIERKAKPTLATLLATYPTANERRADVIRYAKHYVKSTVRIVGMNLYGPDNRVQFLVNTQKRTVVALTRMYENGDIIRKGIAKCDPDDVFNADIGKAIALARALGVEVPTEFVKAVQPTEIVLGHRVYASPTYPNELVAERTSEGDGTIRLALIKVCANHGMARILDDSTAVYE